MRLYVKTTDGTNKLPPTHRHVLLIIDECVVSEMPSLRGSDVRELLLWKYLVERHGDLKVDMLSVGLEAAISGKKLRLNAAMRVARQRAAAVLQSPLGSLEYFRHSGEPESHMAMSRVACVSVACAEIAWVRKRYELLQLRRDLVQRNLREFRAWRGVAVPNWPPSTSTLLCLAALAGNQDAQNALKIKHMSKDKVRNGAFDTLHLEEFGTMCSPDVLGRLDRPSRVGVFVTFDKSLARAVEHFRPVYVNSLPATACEFSHPYLTDAQATEHLKWFSGSGPASTSEGTCRITGLLALAEAKKQLGEMPPKLAALKRRLLWA